MEIYHTFEQPVGSSPTAQALEQAKRLLSCFQKALGHELPNQLVAVQGLARLLAEDQGPRLDDEGRGHLERLAALTRRADDLVRALADLGRLCHEPLDGPPVALAEVVQEAAAEVKLLYPAAATEYHLQQSLPVLAVSRRALYQVVLQLLHNATAAAASDRPLAIEVGGGKVLAPGRGGAEFWVKDNGRGLSYAQLTRLFDPFPAGRNGAGGPGLGLFLVRQIVAGWGGAIRVQSEPGQGTTFALVVP